jgi:ribokinase
MRVSPSPPLSIVVVGSINRDLVVTAPSLPLPGETILGNGYSQHNGGKGANQAVALARLGRDVSMIGCVGHDAHGSSLVEAMRTEGVNVDSVSRSSSHTGIAVITVDRAVENSIVVVPGANADLDGAAVDAAASTIAEANIVLAQLEIPLPSVSRAFDHAVGTVVLNPAPGSKLDAELLDSVDYLIPNRTEMAALSGREVPESDEQILLAIEALGFNGVVIVTLGGEGAVAVHDGVKVASVTPPSVDVVDTVGAGDAFCAGFCDALARDAALSDAIEWATACGALATTKPGAQSSMPNAAAVKALIG